MRVVSQKRDWSVDFERTVFWTQGNLIYAKIDIDSQPFGVYESNERAAEVFRDMHKAYAPVGMISLDLSEEQIKAFVKSQNVDMPVIQMNESDSGVTIFDNIVYYMPEV